MATETIPLHDTERERGIAPGQAATELLALADMLVIATTGDFRTLCDDSPEAYATMIYDRARVLHKREVGGS